MMYYFPVKVEARQECCLKDGLCFLVSAEAVLAFEVNKVFSKKSVERRIYRCRPADTELLLHRTRPSSS